ncbi:HlyC/CorC family transporter [bacterium]|nr:HlyC/CorC family transporter [bacterium]
MFTLILYFLLALAVSFVCSLLESIILSVPRSHIEILKKTHPKSGLILEKFKKQINRPLAAILTFNTIANTVGAAGVGAETLDVFGEKWLAVSSGILTFMILVFSEIIPKVIGAAYSKELSVFASYGIRVLVFIAYPIVIFLEFVSKIVSKKGFHNIVSREEFIVVAEIGENEGTLLKKEIKIIKNLLRLDNILAEDVMTPRSVLFALEKDQTVVEVVKKYSPLPFSRIPVFNENIDDIAGIVLRNEILTLYSQEKKDVLLEKIMTQIHAIPQAKSVSEALDEFIKRREHIFLVVDEHGGTSGIITLEDAIETLLGVEIVDEFDSVEDMRKFALELWEKRKRKINAN